MPKIRKGQTRNSYIPECVAYVMKNEGLTKDQAVGKCEGLYNQHEKKHKKSKASFLDGINEALKNQKSKDA